MADIPSNLNNYVVDEGSIAINGVSLTVAKINGCRVGISVIPHTWNNTTFYNTQIGQKVNIEIDILAKYVEKMINHTNDINKFSKEWFQELGF